MPVAKRSFPITSWKRKEMLISVGGAKSNVFWAKYCNTELRRTNGVLLLICLKEFLDRQQQCWMMRSTTSEATMHSTQCTGWSCRALRRSGRPWAMSWNLTTGTSKMLQWWIIKSCILDRPILLILSYCCQGKKSARDWKWFAALVESITAERTMIHHSALSEGRLTLPLATITPKYSSWI